MLSDNPFHVVDVTVRDQRRRILEQAETMSLTREAAACQEARGILTNPRRRLTAEIAWLPGLAPGRARALVKQALEGDPELVGSLRSVPPLTACNLLR